MIKICVLICLIVLSFTVHSQTNTYIMLPIENLFEGMYKSDTALIKSAFTKNPSFKTIIKDEKGVSNLREGSLENFLLAISKSQPEELAEPIWEPVISNNDQMGTVWVKYAFYYKGKFSHCGIDLFDLMNVEGVWKIFNITDTREKINCEIPESVRKKYEK